MQYRTWKDAYIHAVVRMEHNRPGQSTIAHNQFEYWSAQVTKLAAENPALAGLLTERYDLVRRVAAARKVGQTRPELTVRLRRLNKQIAEVEAA